MERAFSPSSMRRSSLSWGFALRASPQADIVRALGAFQFGISHSFER
jgi:hypothetical protein